MGAIRPGQFVSINGVTYRAKKRDQENLLSCTGCELNSVFKCPNLRFTNVENNTSLNCETDYLIFVKP